DRPRSASRSKFLAWASPRRTRSGACRKVARNGSGHPAPARCRTTLGRRISMRPWSIEMRGRIDEVVFGSTVLEHNPLGDPSRRPFWVYLPPGYDEEPARRYPAIYEIQGLTGQLDMWGNRTAFRKKFPELVDELFSQDGVPPCLVVFVECWTSPGG